MSKFLSILSLLFFCMAFSPDIQADTSVQTCTIYDVSDWGDIPVSVVVEQGFYAVPSAFFVQVFVPVSPVYWAGFYANDVSVFLPVTVYARSCIPNRAKYLFNSHPNHSKNNESSYY